jgi:hypothetical protein
MLSRCVAIAQASEPRLSRTARAGGLIEGRVLAECDSELDLRGWWPARAIGRPGPQLVLSAAIVSSSTRARWTPSRSGIR